MSWSPTSWRTKPIKQDVIYPPETASKLPEIRQKLKQLPGLVTPQEVH